MKLKYYLRGLGIGIAVTTLILSLANLNKNTMTDAEIIEKAKTLGMVMAYEEGVLDESDTDNQIEEVNPEEEMNREEVQEKDSEDLSEEIADASEIDVAPESNIEDTNKEEQNKANEETETSTEAAPNEKRDENEIKESENQTDDEQGTQLQETGKTVVITVNGGDGSDAVARKLEAAGVIKDAKAFDLFLCQKGYDKRLCTGSHTIIIGDDDEAIAQKLMKKG